MNRSQIILIVVLVLIVALFVTGIGLGVRNSDSQSRDQNIPDWLPTIEARLVVPRSLNVSDLRLAEGNRPECRLGEQLMVPAGGSCRFTIPYSQDLKRTINLQLRQGDQANITLRVSGALTRQGKIQPTMPFTATLNRADSGSSALLYIECASTTATTPSNCALVLAR
jgi:hypothetical protein